MKRKKPSSAKGKSLKIKGNVDLAALEEGLSCLRKCSESLAVPPGGWIRTTREALGMTNVQLADRLGRVPQSIEDVQRSEVAGSIKLRSLQTLAEAMGCKLIYAIVPPKALTEMKAERAQLVVQEVVRNLKPGGRRPKAQEKKKLERLVEEMLADNPKLLWR